MRGVGKHEMGKEFENMIMVFAYRRLFQILLIRFVELCVIWHIAYLVCQRTNPTLSFTTDRVWLATRAAFWEPELRVARRDFLFLESSKYFFWMGDSFFTRISPRSFLNSPYPFP